MAEESAEEGRDVSFALFLHSCDDLPAVVKDRTLCDFPAHLMYFKDPTTELFF